MQRVRKLKASYSKHGKIYPNNLKNWVSASSALLRIFVLTRALPLGNDRSLRTKIQTCETGSIAEYEKIEEMLSPSVLNLITEWVLERMVRATKLG
jgi:hypothetical protein